MPKIIIVEDHPLMSKAMTETIEDISPDYRVIYAARKGYEGLEKIREYEPDLALLDYNIPELSGLEIAKSLKTLQINTKVILYSGFDLSPLVSKANECGVSGIFSKNIDSRDMQNIIQVVLSGYIVLPDNLFDLHRAYDLNLDDQDTIIMEMIIRGATQEEIADKIHCSKRTVDNYLKKIYEKMNVKSRLQAIEKYIQIKSW